MTAKITRVLHSRWSDLVVLFILLVLVHGCATPIGVVRGSIQGTYHNLTANVLSAGNPSSWSMQVLQRANLFESFGDDPEGALGALRKTI